MSGIIKSVGKAFKKIVSSPIFKVVAIAVAVYFTAGLAAGAFAAVPAVGATAGTAAIMGAEAMTVGSAALMGGEAVGAAVLGGAAAAEAAGGIGIGLEAGIGSAATAATGAGGLSAAEFSALALAESAESISFAASIAESTGTNMASAASVAEKLGTLGGEFVTSEEALFLGAEGAGGATDYGVAQIAQTGSEAGGIANEAIAAASEQPMFTPAEYTPTQPLTTPESFAPPEQIAQTPTPQAPQAVAPQPTQAATTASPVTGSTGMAPGEGAMQGPGLKDVAALGQEKGAFAKTMDWFSNLPKPVQKIVSQGLGNMASEGVKAIALNSQQNAIEKSKEQARQDVIRRSGVPYVWGQQSTQPANVAAYKTPGIINSAGA